MSDKLTQYFIRNFKQGIIDFSVRADVSIDAFDQQSVHLVIHPDGKDGETLDYFLHEATAKEMSE